MLGIASMLLRRFGFGLDGRIRFTMVAGIAIGVIGILLGVTRSRTDGLVIGVVVLVTNALFWPWVLRVGRRRGTL